MDILAFLKDDHQEIQRELQRIAVGFQRPSTFSDPRDRLKKLVARLQLHEGFEDRALFAMDQALGREPEGELASEFRKAHEAVWIFLELTLEALGSESPSFISRAFSKFESRLLSHMKKEEELLFPRIRRALSASVCEELGEKAERAFAAAGYSHPRFPSSAPAKPVSFKARPLKAVYWEVTAGCNLNCTYCLREPMGERDLSREMTLEAAREFIDDLARLGPSRLVFCGGEPLHRGDLVELVRQASSAGLQPHLVTNAMLATEEISRRLRSAGARSASVVLNGAGPKTHDAFRGAGSFERAVEGLNALRRADFEVRVQFTAIAANAREIEAVHRTAVELGASGLDLYLMVPMGCGSHFLEDATLSADDMEKCLEQVAVLADESQIGIRVLCAPHYQRIRKSRGDPADSEESGRKGGCSAGIDYCFVSHEGEVFPCAYLPLAIGNVRRKPLSEIWADSAVLGRLRETGSLNGRCGLCEFRESCGGCRARAYVHSASLMAEDPSCSWPSREDAGVGRVS